MNDKPKTLHAFFSQEQQDLPRLGASRHRITYQRITGERVRVSCVFGTKEQGEQGFLWPDRVYVGEVWADSAEAEGAVGVVTGESEARP